MLGDEFTGATGGWTPADQEDADVGQAMSNFGSSYGDIFTVLNGTMDVATKAAGVFTQFKSTQDALAQSQATRAINAAQSDAAVQIARAKAQAAVLDAQAAVVPGGSYNTIMLILAAVGIYFAAQGAK